MNKSILTHLLFGAMLALHATGMESDQWRQDLQALIALDTQSGDSIQGLDIDRDGIRDDVEAYVKRKYKNDAFQRDLFLEAAKKIQHILSLPKNAPLDEHKKLDRDLLSLYTCRDYILYRNGTKDMEKALVDKTLFKAKVLNTKERFSAYVAHKQKLPKSFYDLTEDALKRDKTECLQRYSRYQNPDIKAQVSLNVQ